MGPYYAGVGPEDGILMYGHVDGSIEVFEDPCRSIPVGTARCIGWDAAGSAVWRLVLHDDEVEGPWLIVDREFLSTRPDWRDLYRCDAYHDHGLTGWGSARKRLRRGRRPEKTAAERTEAPSTRS